MRENPQSRLLTQSTQRRVAGHSTVTVADRIVTGRPLVYSTVKYAKVGFCGSLVMFFAYKKLLGRTETRTRDRMHLGRYDQLETYLETIEQELRPAVCVNIQEPLGSSDHNQVHFNIKIKSDKPKVSRCKRNFRKGNYKEIRTMLEHIDWNDKMKNKTGAESWNILKSELDSVINRYVPMKKQGKRSKKKHLSKEAFKKIRYKQDMWRVYKHTGKDKDYDVYKEALNAATNEVRKSKRNFEHKLAQNIKSDSKSFYAYVRSKQNVRDKVGPLEDNAGNIITEGVLMAEELNMHFSSVFTREDTSSLPVPGTKFNGTEGERLGQLVITPEVIANKINK